MTTTHTIINAECLGSLRKTPDDSVDLVLTSPPYEDARHLTNKQLRQLSPAGWSNGQFRLSGQSYVEWLVPIIVECCRVSRGLVCVVIEGRTKSFSYSATPLLVAAAIQMQVHRKLQHNDYAPRSPMDYEFKIHLRKPMIYRRSGIAGSGGPDYLRNDYEFVLVFSKHRRLAWSDNTAMGGPPKYKRGGKFSHHTQNGRLKDGKEYPQLEIANPGNVIDCNVGGGHMGSKYAHSNEAPFAESLAEFIIRSFCPPSKDYSAVDRIANWAIHAQDGAFGGIVLDPFAGSGTVSAVAAKTGRNSVSIELRRSAYSLIKRRLRNDCKAKLIGRKQVVPHTETLECRFTPTQKPTSDHKSTTSLTPATPTSKGKSSPAALSAATKPGMRKAKLRRTARRS